MLWLFRKKRRIISILLLLFIGLIYWQAPFFIVEIDHPIIELVRKKRIPQQVSLSHNQKVVSLNHQGLVHKAILTKSNTDTTKATIIVVHGIRGRKEWWHTKSLVLADSSYQTLAIDLRAHGESEGRFTTFGVKEKEDIQAWVNWLQTQPNMQNQPLGIWGQSLGGAVSLQALAIEPELEFGIIESTFHDFRTVAGDYMKDYTGIRAQPITDHFLRKAAKLADFDIDEAKPRDACSNITQPVLFIHGTQDQKIDMEYNRLNFNAVPHSNKEFYEIKDAGHYNVWNVGGKDYRDKVLDFIEQNAEVTN